VSTLYQNISPWGDLWLGPRDVYVAHNATYEAPDEEVSGLNAQPTNWRVV